MVATWASWVRSFLACASTALSPHFLSLLSSGRLFVLWLLVTLPLVAHVAVPLRLLHSALSFVHSPALPETNRNNTRLCCVQLRRAPSLALWLSMPLRRSRPRARSSSLLTATSSTSRVLYLIKVPTAAINIPRHRVPARTR